MSALPYGPMQGAPPLPSDRYWASCDTQDLPQLILAKALRYRERLRRDGRLELWRRTERTYYGRDGDGGMANSAAVTFGGENGELVMIRINHFASLLQALLALAVSKRPAYEPRASNTDAESAQQVTIAKSLLDYYTRKLHLETKRQDVARTSELFGEGYTCIRWNPFIGEAVGQDNGQPVREGDLEAHVLTPLEVIHDLDRTEEDLDWVICAYRENVWNLAARYPGASEKILSMRGGATSRWPRSAWSDSPWERQTATAESDIVTVWWLYHMPCDAMPQGRHAQVVGDVVVHDGPMELEEIPVWAIMPEREVSLARGHSRMFDLLALQEAYDSIADAILTNIDAYGVNSIVVAKGTDIAPEQIAKGVQLIEVEFDEAAPNGGMPTVLKMLDLPQALPAALEMIQHLMETLCGVNSVTRGDPMPQLKSGAALALVQSLAVAFNTALQSAVVRHDERVATGIISMLKKYAHNKRQVEIVGKSQAGAMQAWSQDNLTTVQRVTVEVGSPLMDQAAGKLEVAQQLLTAGLIKDPQQYIEVLTTGRLEPLYFAEKRAADLIARENEQLADGNPPIGPATPMVGPDGQPVLGPDGQPAMNPPPRAVQARLTDDHALHCYEHTAVLAEAHVRSNPQLADVVMQHILEHQKFWMSMGPELGMLTKQSVPPPPVIPQSPPPGPPQSNGKAPGGLQLPPPNPDRAAPLGQGGNTPPDGPMLPTNPLTGQRAPNPRAT